LEAAVEPINCAIDGHHANSASNNGKKTHDSDSFKTLDGSFEGGEKGTD
jgi:hypothetical protein